MSNKNFAIVGCGAAAKKYYLPVLKKLSGIASRVYCVDRNSSIAREFAEDLGSKYYLEDYQDIIDEVIGVIVAVPPFLHHPIGMDFIEKKVHVLCEKPLAESYKDAEEMVKTALEKNVTLCINNTRRLFPNFAMIKELVSNGTIGTLQSIKYFEANKFAWESMTNFYVNSKITQKGIWLDLGSHVIDLICWWLNGSPEIISFEDDSFGGPESLAKLKAKLNSCKIEVILNRHLDVGNLFILEGNKGKIFGSLAELKSLGLEINSGRKRFLKIDTDFKKYSDIVKAVIHNFFNVVLEGEKPLIPGEAVLPSIRFIDEGYQNRSRLAMPWNENLETLFDE